jgi:HAD superfamily hydrolase (TIGR01490 family)
VHGTTPGSVTGGGSADELTLDVTIFTDNGPTSFLGWPLVEAAFFDLDKTVIARASMVAFGKPLYRAGLLSRWLLLRALYGQLVYLYLGADEARMAKMREAALRVTVGWSRDHIRSLVRETLEEVIEPIIFDEALDLIRHHQAQGRKVFIVSASPEEIVDPLAEYLGVDDVIATRPKVDEHGRYSGDVDFYSYGPSKVTAMEEMAERDGIDLAASYAYSDSITDEPMLSAVGHPVAVNPDRALARIAAEREWEVRIFERPVRMRERVSMPTPGRTAAISGGLAAIVAGVVVFWVLRHRPAPSRRERLRGAVLAQTRRTARPWGRAAQRRR